MDKQSVTAGCRTSSPPFQSFEQSQLPGAPVVHKVQTQKPGDGILGLTSDGASVKWFA